MKPNRKLRCNERKTANEEKNIKTVPKSVKATGLVPIDLGNDTF